MLLSLCVAMSCPRFVCLLFFFQAEDGIRDYKVTGVQTCALPIFADAVHVVPLARELAHDELAQVALVVGDQDADLATHAGSTTRKRLPLPGREVTSIRPPWSVTIPWAMASPRPVPCPGGLVVKNGSKIRGRTSSGTPGPSSSNSTSTSPRCRRERTVSRPRPSIASSAFEARAMKTWRIWPSLIATAGS